MITVEIQRNAEAARVCGTYNEKGGIAKKPLEDTDVCPKCGSNEHIECSKYVGFVYCKSCDFDYPSFLGVKDPVEATQKFIKYVDEILSNFDNVQKFRDLYERYQYVWELHVKTMYGIDLAKTIRNTMEWKNYVLHYAKHGYELEGNMSKDAKRLKRSPRIPKYVLMDFFSYLRTDPFVDEDMKEIISIKTSKITLIDLLEEKDERIAQLEARLDEYGLL
mgnify:CR=1 FL=1|tara:strand:- start:538 stop:1197 length:660 start_codon:yes stop_codon:yes gene_type:complete